MYQKKKRKNIVIINIEIQNIFMISNKDRWYLMSFSNHLNKKKSNYMVSCLTAWVCVFTRF
jgi:hypothetical protein